MNRALWRNGVSERDGRPFVRGNAANTAAFAGGESGLFAPCTNNPR